MWTFMSGRVCSGLIRLSGTMMDMTLGQVSQVYCMEDFEDKTVKETNLYKYSAGTTSIYLIGDIPNMAWAHNRMFLY